MHIEGSVSKLPNDSGGYEAPFCLQEVRVTCSSPFWRQKQRALLPLPSYVLCLTWAISQSLWGPSPRTIQLLQLWEQEVLLLVLTFLNLCRCPLLDRGLGDLNLLPKSRKGKSMWCDSEEDDEILWSLKKKVCTFRKVNYSPYLFWALQPSNLL